MFIRHGEEIEFFCPDGFESPKESSFPDQKHVLAKCQNSKFNVKGINYNFEQFVCKVPNNQVPNEEMPNYDASFRSKSTTSSDCATGLFLKVGYPIDDDGSKRFVEQMEICFDNVNETTLYVSHKIGGDKLRSSERPRFHTARYFQKKNVDDLYKFSNQKQIFETILGASEAGKYLIEKQQFLTRGHLAAKSDFSFDAQQKATFLFLNSAPQWNNFNSNNWADFEASVQDFSKRKRMTLDCYTGTYGVMTLPDKNKIDQKIYLNKEIESGQNQIPVPKYYFRVLMEQPKADTSRPPIHLSMVEQRKRKGVVIVGVNNPYMTEAEIKADMLCSTDVFDRIEWLSNKLKVNKQNRDLGYMYACEVKDFIRNVRFLPALYVNGLLER